MNWLRPRPKLSYNQTPTRMHTRVFSDRNYRVGTAVPAHNNLDHGIPITLNTRNFPKIRTAKFMVSAPACNEGAA